MPEWSINEFGRSDKSIQIDGPLRLEVDYDDVDTDAVDLLLPLFLDILNKHWHPLDAWRCENEDCEESEEYWRIRPEPGNCSACGEPRSPTLVDASA